MAGALSPEEVARFERLGALWPIPVFGADEIAERLARLEAIEAARAGRLPPSFNIKAHLLLPWLWDLVHDPRVVGPVQEVLGPDVLCWASSFFAKQPDSAAHVPWHQDATYWGLSEPRALTAWIAFTPSAPDNGGMRIAPRSHLAPVPHARIADDDNMLPKREMILAEVDEASALDVVLAPGEMSLHHVLAVHGSGPNLSGARRVGFAVRYIAGDLKQTDGRGAATLVAGRDHGHFDLEQAPEGELDPAAMRRYALSLRRWMATVFGPGGPARQ